jgi:urea transporter
MNPRTANAALSMAASEGGWDVVGPDATRPETASAPATWRHRWSLLRARLPKHSPAPFLASVFRCYSEVFFVNGSVLFGALIFACTLLNWRIGAAGILAVVAAYAFARVIRLDYEFFQPGFYTYNPLLVGLSLGAMLELSWLTAFFIVSAAVFTLLLTIAMVHLFRQYLSLPVLSLPFALCSASAYLASLRYSNLLVRSPEIPPILATDLQLPLAVSGFLKCLGAVFLLPHDIVGVLIAALLLWRSRILFFLAVLGYYTGALARTAMIGSAAQALGDISGFNFILIAMALGGVFLTPSPGSYFIAVVAVTGSTIFLDSVQVFGSLYGIPVYTLPFNVVSLGVIYVLGLTAYPRMARYIGLTPEETLEYDAVNRRRYPGQLRMLSLPFFGQWTVWQAFDGQWTHKANWRHACDFVITNDDGKTFDGPGGRLEEYLCFRKPVLAPIRGRVISAVSDLPDNPIGQVDKANNWGNYVLLYDERGYYVKLAHFARESIRVKPGDWVEPGTILGLCGNSGYSPQPHIHVHVQAVEYVGAPTLPFSFLSYIESNEYHANDLPPKGARVEPAGAVDAQLDKQMSFLLGDVVTYDVVRDGEQVDTLTLRVNMAADGTLCFESDRGGRLYFGQHGGTFYFYRAEGGDRYLNMLLLALPRLPLTYRHGLEWHDYVPMSLVASGPQRMVAGLAASVVPGLATARCTLSFQGRNVIESEVTSSVFGIQRTTRVQLDAQRGFASVQLGRSELRRAKYVSST